MDPNLVFKLSEEYIKKAKAIYNLVEQEEVPTDNGLSKVVYVRTYSRNMFDALGKYTGNETLFDTWLRCVNGIYSLAKQKYPLSKKWNETYWQQEAYTMLKLFISKKLSPSGRGLWNLGTSLVHSKQIGMALFNCAFITSANIDEIKAEYFCFIMYGLMVGSGVGLDDAGAGKIMIEAPTPGPFMPCADIEPLCMMLKEMMPFSRKRMPPHNSIYLGEVEENKLYLQAEIDYMQNIATYHPSQYTVFKIPDDRAGWIEALRRLLNSYFRRDYIVLFDYSLIRKRGEYLITSGGKASGPQPLAEAISIIRYLLQNHIGKPISAELILDIANVIGMMVVAGNVRRSSEIFCFRDINLAEIKKAYVRVKDKAGNIMTDIKPKPGVSSIESDEPIPELDDRIACDYDERGCLVHIATTYKIAKDDQGNLTILDPDGIRIVKLFGCSHMQRMIPHTKYQYRTMPEAWANNSNNSFIIDDRWSDDEYRKVLDYLLPMIDETSEPGIFNIELCRHYGRIIDGYGDFDLGVEGPNPCGEVTLEGRDKVGGSEGDKPQSAGGELCCLVENNMSRMESEQDFLKVLEYATFIAKMMCTVRIEWKATDRIQQRNYRVGVSQTGIMEYLTKTEYNMEAYAQLCDIGYKKVRATDEKISQLFDIPKSIKVTTVKPSGTIGTFLGTTSGMHGPMAEYIIRRMRISKEYPHILNGLKNAGYDIEDDVTQSNTTSVVSFPVSYQKGIKTKKSFTLKEQFELLRILQTYWSDNAVSVTIFYQEGELEKLKEYLIEYRRCIKGASFSKYFDVSSTQYKQLPQEEITEKEYLAMKAKLKPFKISDLLPESETKEVELDNLCDGEKCQAN